ncbi:MAG: hypothetical protein ABFS02_03800 [Pseudomonadota bacterium]
MCRIHDPPIRVTPVKRSGTGRGKPEKQPGWSEAESTERALFFPDFIVFHPGYSLFADQIAGGDL